jgi:hypothetical protein
MHVLKICNVYLKCPSVWGMSNKIKEKIIFTFLVAYYM